MQWYWEFNPGQLYISCFEVEVAANDGESSDDGTTGTGGGDGGESSDDGTTGTGGGDGGTTTTDSGEPVVTDPTVDSTCDVVEGTDMIDFLALPRTIDPSTILFTLQICYAATTPVTIVGEALDARSGAPLGVGYVDVATTSTPKEIYMSVELTEEPRLGTNSILLRAWNTEKKYHRQWPADRTGTSIEAYELTRRETIMGVSESGAHAAVPPSSLVATVFAGFLYYYLMGC